MNYDPLETCPYDPAHRILRSRMQYHLSKCAKNWPCAKKKQCPYDARHIVNQIEFNYHVSICPQRESVWRYKLVENAEIRHPKILPIDSTPVVPVSEENWEDDGKVKSYNPMKSTENRPVIRTLIGAQKAQRKHHQMQERLRLSRLDDATVVQKESAVQNNSNQRASVPVKATIPEEASAEVEQEYKPLRRPKKLPLDSSKISDFSTINDSTAGLQTQNSIDQNKSLQPQNPETCGKENIVAQPKEVPSYAGALKQKQNISIESDCDVVIESVKYDGKESNSSFFNNTIDENLIKVSKTVEQLTIDDEGHKMQSKFLDKTLESLKKPEQNKSAIGNGVNNNTDNIFTKERRSFRCAANFTNSKC